MHQVVQLFPHNLEDPAVHNSEIFLIGNLLMSRSTLAIHQPRGQATVKGSQLIQTLSILFP